MRWPLLLQQSWEGLGAYTGPAWNAGHGSSSITGNNGERGTSWRPEVELGVQGSPTLLSITIPGWNCSACPPRPGPGGSGPPHRAARPSPPCAPDVTPRRGKRGGKLDGSLRLGVRTQGAIEGPSHMQPPFTPLPGQGPGHGLSLPSPDRTRPHPSPFLGVQVRPVSRTATALQYRDVDEGFPRDSGPDGGRVLIAHDGRVLTGPVRHEVVDVGVPPGHGAATGAVLGAAAGAAGWAPAASGWRAGGGGELGTRAAVRTAALLAVQQPSHRHFLLLPPPSRFYLQRAVGAGPASHSLPTAPPRLSRYLTLQMQF